MMNTEQTVQRKMRRMLPPMQSSKTKIPMSGTMRQRKGTFPPESTSGAKEANETAAPYQNFNRSAQGLSNPHNHSAANGNGKRYIIHAQSVKMQAAAAVHRARRNGKEKIFSAVTAARNPNTLNRLKHRYHAARKHKFTTAAMA